MQANSILIIGGGIAGLTAAIALRRKGYAVEIIEKDPEWSVYGVGIIQQANVVRVMASLDLLDDYLASSYGFDEIKIFAPSGEMVAKIPAPKLAGENYPANLGIRRTKLQEVLSNKAKGLGADVRLGITADAFDDDGSAVDVSFSDGGTGRYDIVIGADGLYSQTRTQIMPEAASPTYTGQCVWRYNFARTDDVDCLHAYEGRNGMGLVPLSNDLMYMYMLSQEPADSRMETAGIAAQMRDRMKGAAPAIALLRDQVTNDDEVVYKPLETHFLDGDWHRGRIVLAGDAVHATTPHLGQGAGMAIEDAVVLAEEIEAAQTPEEAFTAYRKRRYERCRYIYEASISLGEAQMGKIDPVDVPGLTFKSFEVTAEPI